MQTPGQTLIVEIERRLSERKVSVARICRGANTDRITWQRWKGGSQPRHDTWAAVRSELVKHLGTDVPERFPAAEAA